MSDDSIFSAAGFDLAPAASAPVAAPPSGSVFKDAGFSLPVPKTAPAKAKSAQFSDEIPIPVPGTPEYDSQKVNDPSTADTLENRIAAITHATDPLTVIPAAARSWWDSTKQNALSAGQQYQTGLGQIRSNLTGSGVGNVGLGILGMAGSPLTGAADAFIAQPTTQLTGNPDIGRDVGNLSTMLLPTKGGAAAVKASNENRAINALVQTIGPENVPAAVARLQSNPRLSLMDVSDPVRTVAQGLIDPAQPQAQNILTQAVNQRKATLPAATNSAFTAAMGPTPNVPQILGNIKKQATDVGTNLIQPAIANAKPVDTSGVIASIDKELKPGVQAFAESSLPLSPYQQELSRIKQQLTADNGETLTDPARLHAVQASIRADAQNLLSSSTGSDRNLGSKLMGVRNQLVDAIDNASGGSYKPALQKYRDAMQVNEAFESGFDTLKNRSGVNGLEDRPEMFQQWMDNASPEEVVARRLGTRLDIDQKIRSVKNQALAGQNITNIEYNRDKLASLFGGPEADRLIRTMGDAADEARTNAKILEGSKTAETLAGREALKIPQVGGGNVLNWMGGPAAELAGEYLLGPGGAGIGSALFGGAKAAQYGTQLAARSLARNRNIEFAKAASATGPARQDLISALSAHPDVVSQFQKSGNALSALPSP